MKNFMKHNALWTNLIGLAFLTIIILAAILLELKIGKRKYKFTTKKIAFYGAFISVTVVIGLIMGVISDQIMKPGFEYKIGVVLALIPGAIFGPLAGIICGFLSDFIGSIGDISSGAYNIGFGFEMALTGFVGGIIFIVSNKRNWIIWTIGLFTINFLLQEWLITPLFLLGEGTGTWSIFLPGMPKAIIEAKCIKIVISCAIKLPTFLVIYFVLFRTSYNCVSLSFDKKEIWAVQKFELFNINSNKTNENTDEEKYKTNFL